MIGWNILHYFLNLNVFPRFAGVHVLPRALIGSFDLQSVL